MKLRFKLRSIQFFRTILIYKNYMIIPTSSNCIFLINNEFQNLADQETFGIRQLILVIFVYFYFFDGLRILTRSMFAFNCSVARNINTHELLFPNIRAARETNRINCNIRFGKGVPARK